MSKCLIFISKISKIFDIFDIFENITIFSNPASRCVNVNHAPLSSSVAVTWSRGTADRTSRRLRTGALVGWGPGGGWRHERSQKSFESDWSQMSASQTTYSSSRSANLGTWKRKPHVRRSTLNSTRPRSSVVAHLRGEPEKNVTLNDTERRNGRYIAFTEFSKSVFQHITASICGGIYTRVYVVRKVHVHYLISWWVSCISQPTLYGTAELRGINTNCASAGEPYSLTSSTALC